ncbi:MAG: glycoside hydrolase 43 family protein [Niabella sp.]
MIKPLLFISCFVLVIQANAQKNYVSKVWVSDNGNGTYTNPVINADYSDPDAIRVGEDYYMISSSFDQVPGLPILHSKDLVNWKIIGHALQRQIPVEVFNKNQHGNGVWAPAIRHHNNEFYIYYPDPDFGIYMIKATSIAGPWSNPVLVEGGAGLIDPCPLWDDDGKVYLSHAYAGSRAGIKSILVIKEMNTEGTKTISNGVMVYDGHELDPTIEGPKVYKRNGYYYLFAPAGGVATGWQLVLRSKNIYGPYERKVVMEQGKTSVNGPHQGAWVNTKSGEDWFLHFQDKEAIGRVVHLQPMKWVNDWPVIGEDKDGDGNGNPVLRYKKPYVGKVYPIETPVDADEFNNVKLGLQWQWQANPQATWSFMNTQKGTLRLFAHPVETGQTLWNTPHVLLQKFPSDAFTVVTKLSFTPSDKFTGEKAGLTTMAMNYGSIAIKRKENGNVIVFTTCEKADRGGKEIEKEIAPLHQKDIYFRMQFKSDTTCIFSYSLNGDKFIEVGTVKATPGKWIGSKTGLFITSNVKINDAGFVDVDWFRVEK